MRLCAQLKDRPWTWMAWAGSTGFPSTLHTESFSCCKLLLILSSSAVYNGDLSAVKWKILSLFLIFLDVSVIEGFIFRPFGCHQSIRFKKKRWWIVNVYEETVAIRMMVMKSEVKRWVYWDASPEPRMVEESGPVGLGITIVPRWMERLIQQPLQIHYFFRNMPRGTRFASFTLSEQPFLMLSYFSWRIENCWNKWLENSYCIHSWHWNWQIASFPTEMESLLFRDTGGFEGEGVSAFYFTVTLLDAVLE